MMDRREVMAAATGAALLAPGLARAGTAAPARAPDVVFFDPRHADSIAFAQAMALRGASPRSTIEDLATFWRGGGEQAFRQAAAPRLSGLTLHSDLFVLSALAREAGGRLVHEGRHDCRTGAAAHTVCKGEIDVAQLDGAAWAPALAALLSPGAAPAATAPVGTRGVTLFSWSIEKI